MSKEQIQKHIDRLRRAGWTDDEIRDHVKDEQLFRAQDMRDAQVYLDEDYEDD